MLPNASRTHPVTVIINALRPREYIKNLSIFFPAFFSQQLLVTDHLLLGTIGFITFSVLASGIYLFNDYQDLEFDRVHPQKKYRPMASGQLSPQIGIGISVVLLLLGVMISIYFGWAVLGVSGAYVLLNMAYSFKLKQIPILDVFSIAMGFVLRLYFGSFLMGISLSHWIILVTFLLAIFLGFSKRYHDVILYDDDHIKRRDVIDGYTQDLLQMYMSISATLVIVSYLFYTLAGIHRPHIIIVSTSVYVIFGLLYYVKLTVVDHHTQSPTHIVYTSRLLQLTIFLWALSFCVHLYIL